MSTPTTTEKCTCFMHTPDLGCFEDGVDRGPPVWHHQSARARPRDDLTTAVHDGSHDTRAAVHDTRSCDLPAARHRAHTFIWKHGVKLKMRADTDLSAEHDTVESEAVGTFCELSRGAWRRTFNHLWLDMKDFTHRIFKTIRHWTDSLFIMDWQTLTPYLIPMSSVG